MVSAIKASAQAATFDAALASPVISADRFDHATCSWIISSSSFMTALSIAHLRFWPPACGCGGDSREMASTLSATGWTSWILPFTVAPVLFSSTKRLSVMPPTAENQRSEAGSSGSVATSHAWRRAAMSRQTPSPRSCRWSGDRGGMVGRWGLEIEHHPLPHNTGC